MLYMQIPPITENEILLSNKILNYLKNNGETAYTKLIMEFGIKREPIQNDPTKPEFTYLDVNNVINRLVKHNDIVEISNGKEPLKYDILRDPNKIEIVNYSNRFRKYLFNKKKEIQLEAYGSVGKAAMGTCMIQLSLLEDIIKEFISDDKKQDVKYPNNLKPYQYHGKASSMPKRLKEYFASIEKTFSENAMVDVIEWVQIELLNEWEDSKDE